MDLKLPYNENELITSVKQKNPDAFAELYDRYSPALYTVILQIVRNDEAGNKVVRKVFMIIWDTIDDFDPTKTRLFTWMLQIARTEAIDEIRLSGYQNILHQASIPAKATSNQLPILEIDNVGLKKVVQNLKDEQKTAIDLYYFMGFSSEQIAKNLSVSEDVVKSRIRTSLSEIRILLPKKS